MGNIISSYVDRPRCTRHPDGTRYLRHLSLGRFLVSDLLELDDNDNSIVAKVLTRSDDLINVSPAKLDRLDALLSTNIVNYVTPTHGLDHTVFPYVVAAQRALRDALAPCPNCLAPTVVLDTFEAMFIGRPYASASILSAHLHEHPADKLWITYQMIAAVAQAHEVGVIHSNIKANNFLLTSSGLVLLTDFAPHVPQTVPRDSTVAFSFFFDGSETGNCSLAPERIGCASATTYGHAHHRGHHPSMAASMAATSMTFTPETFSALGALSAGTAAAAVAAGNGGSGGSGGMSTGAAAHTRKPSGQLSNLQPLTGVSPQGRPADVFALACAIIALWLEKPTVFTIEDIVGLAEGTPAATATRAAVIAALPEQLQAGIDSMLSVNPSLRPTAADMLNWEVFPPFFPWMHAQTLSLLAASPLEAISAMAENSAALRANASRVSLGQAWVFGTAPTPPAAIPPPPPPAWCPTPGRTHAHEDATGEKFARCHPSFYTQMVDLLISMTSRTDISVDNISAIMGLTNGASDVFIVRRVIPWLLHATTNGPLPARAAAVEAIGTLARGAAVLHPPFVLAYSATLQRLAVTIRSAPVSVACAAIGIVPDLLVTNSRIEINSALLAAPNNDAPQPELTRKLGPIVVRELIAATRARPALAGAVARVSPRLAPFLPEGDGHSVVSSLYDPLRRICLAVTDASAAEEFFRALPLLLKTSNTPISPLEAILVGIYHVSQPVVAAAVAAAAAAAPFALTPAHLAILAPHIAALVPSPCAFVRSPAIRFFTLASQRMGAARAAAALGAGAGEAFPGAIGRCRPEGLVLHAVPPISHWAWNMAVNAVLDFSDDATEVDACDTQPPQVGQMMGGGGGAEEGGRPVPPPQVTEVSTTANSDEPVSEVRPPEAGRTEGGRIFTVPPPLRPAQPSRMRFSKILVSTAHDAIYAKHFRSNLVTAHLPPANVFLRSSFFAGVPEHEKQLLRVAFPHVVSSAEAPSPSAPLRPLPKPTHTFSLGLAPPPECRLRLADSNLVVPPPPSDGATRPWPPGPLSVYSCTGTNAAPAAVVGARFLPSGTMIDSVRAGGGVVILPAVTFGRAPLMFITACGRRITAWRSQVGQSSAKPAGRAVVGADVVCGAAISNAVALGTVDGQVITMKLGTTKRKDKESSRTDVKFTPITSVKVEPEAAVSHIVMLHRAVPGYEPVLAAAGPSTVHFVQDARVLASTTIPAAWGVITAMKPICGDESPAALAVVTSRGILAVVSVEFQLLCAAWSLGRAATALEPDVTPAAAAAGAPAFFVGLAGGLIVRLVVHMTGGVDVTDVLVVEGGTLPEDIDLIGMPVRLDDIYHPTPTPALSQPLVTNLTLISSSEQLIVATADGSCRLWCLRHPELSAPLPGLAARAQLLPGGVLGATEHAFGALLPKYTVCGSSPRVVRESDPLPAGVAGGTFVSVAVIDPPPAETIRQIITMSSDGNLARWR